MFKKIRQIPLVCLFISLTRMLFGKIRLSKKYLKATIQMENGRKFTIFRHIINYPGNKSPENCVFVVNFKFAKLSHNANKLASIIPMLFITGYPGFISKIYAVNHETGYWQ